MKRYWLLKEKKMSLVFTIHHWLLLSSVFSVILLLARIIFTGYFSYVFLPWNLFLAYIPYQVSRWLARNPQILESKLRLLIVLLAWLLFMPNTFYILTDLFHLDDMDSGHQWFDLTMILSFAWNGILFGILSIRQMEILLKTARGKWLPGFIICTVMWLNAFGIYIGRFLRFNSWDIITNPFSLFGEIFDIIFNPYDYRYVWAMTFCFGLFMIILYYSIKKLKEVF